jgi:hypothetical protein
MRPLGAPIKPPFTHFFVTEKKCSFTKDYGLLYNQEVITAFLFFTFFKIKFKHLLMLTNSKI